MTLLEKIYDIVNIVSKHDLTEEQVMAWLVENNCIQQEIDSVIGKYRSL